MGVLGAAFGAAVMSIENEGSMVVLGIGAGGILGAVLGTPLGFGVGSLFPAWHKLHPVP
jgi:hypothetical protein